MGISVPGARHSLVIGLSLVLGACGGDDGPAAVYNDTDSPPIAGNPSPSTPPSSPGGTPDDPPAAPGNPPSDDSTPPAAGDDNEPPLVQNSPPTISGAPQTMALQETPYVFAPVANDGDGDILHFRIANAPPWATFEPSTGRLHGTPMASDLGTYADISISVTDGADDAMLEPFSITVTAVANGAVELSWAAPTENMDGSALTDLAGYRIYWGTQPEDLANSITIENPGIVTYVLEDLVPATYYFVATAVNAEGAESDPSDTTTLTIS